jgi:peptidyl-prolyl cis-trans isomerase C
MRQIARPGLPLLALAALAAVASAQTTPTADTKAKAAAPTPPADTVAVIDGEAVPKRELIDVLGQFQIPPGNEARAYELAIDYVVNTKVLEQFLRRSGTTVDPKEIQNVYDQYSQDLEAQKMSLTQALADSGTTPDEFKARITRSLQWKNYLKKRASDSELASYVTRNQDVFGNTRIRVSHILLKVPEDAPEAEKAKVRQKLEAIKQEIAGGKISFADAANKYSEDEGAQTAKKGGDLGFFTRKGQFVEPFSAAAFALKGKPIGTISDPVETDYGLHLIQLTGVEEGEKLDPTLFLQQNKQSVLNLYALELQNQIVESERARLQAEGKIQVMPMPADLFQTIPQQPAAPPAGAAAAPATGAAQPKAAR